MEYPGLTCPSFLLFSEPETAARRRILMRWLAIRGEFEKRLTTELTSDYSESSIADSVKKAVDKAKSEYGAEKPPKVKEWPKKAAAAEFKKYSQEEFPAAVEETANLLADFWTRAEDPESLVIPTVPRVVDTPESRERGRLLYLSDNTKCYTCHVMTGYEEMAFPLKHFGRNRERKLTIRIVVCTTTGVIPLKPRNLTLGHESGRSSANRSLPQDARGNQRHSDAGVRRHEK